MTLIVVLVSFCSSADNAGERLQNQAASNSEVESQKTSVADKIYSSTKVDVKAIVDQKSRDKNLPRTSDNCPVRGQVSLRLVLHSSGKVTGVEVIEGTGCGYDQNAVKAARKIKFTPAMKNGFPVSQYLIIRYQYWRG